MFMTPLMPSNIVQRKHRPANFLERQARKELRGKAGGVDIDDLAGDPLKARPMLQFRLGRQDFAFGRFDSQAAEMIDLKNQGGTCGENDFDAAAVKHHWPPATIGSRVEGRCSRVHSIVDNPHATTDLDRIAMKLVYLPANGEGDLLPDPRCDRFLDS